MQWYNYLAAFWCGAFFANTIPHFVKGICGDPFPTPFAKPPGQGLSSPLINVLWALFNGVIAFLLWRSGKISREDPGSLLLWFAGVALMSVFASRRFATKHKESQNG